MQDDGGFYGVQGGAATFQNVPALRQRLLHGRWCGVPPCRREWPRRAVDHDNWELSQCFRPLLSCTNFSRVIRDERKSGTFVLLVTLGYRDTGTG